MLDDDIDFDLYGDVSTTQRAVHLTMTHGQQSEEGGDSRPAENELTPYYRSLLRRKRFQWTVHYRLIRRLGSGGQGVVYLTEVRGADSFTVPVALKVFAPEQYLTWIPPSQP